MSLLIFAFVLIAFMEKQISRGPYPAFPKVLLNINLSLYTYFVTEKYDRIINKRLSSRTILGLRIQFWVRIE